MFIEYFLSGKIYGTLHLAWYSGGFIKILLENHFQVERLAVTATVVSPDAQKHNWISFYDQFLAIQDQSQLSSSFRLKMGMVWSCRHHWNRRKMAIFAIFFMLNTIIKCHVRSLLATFGLKYTKTAANLQQNDMLSMFWNHHRPWNKNFTRYTRYWWQGIKMRERI